MKSTMLIALLLILQSELVYADTEMRFSGTLVEEPCTLAPEDSAIEIDFGTVITKLLYSHKRTAGRAFTLHLLECDLSLGSSVSITFIADEDMEQPGLIALDTSSTASGIAIGMETLEKIAIPVNKPGPNYQLKPQENEFYFNIFISASHDAINMKKIKPGSLNTKTTLEINYE